MSIDTKFERNALLQNSKQAWSRTQTVVKRVLGEKHTLQWMSLADRQRLTVLLVWEQRYKVPLEWIVERLLLHYQGKRKRVLSGRRYRNPALPVRVVTLVSPTSREIIEKEIVQEFPGDTHVNVWQMRMRSALLEQIYQEQIGDHAREHDVLSRPFTDFPTLIDFVQAYSERIERQREILGRMADHRRRGGKPYRNSPWR